MTVPNRTAFLIGQRWCSVQRSVPENAVLVRSVQVVNFTEQVVGHGLRQRMYAVHELRQRVLDASAHVLHVFRAAAVLEHQARARVAVVAGTALAQAVGVTGRDDLGW